jgi:sulfonate transport system substrate-binding protein
MLRASIRNFSFLRSALLVVSSLCSLHTARCDNEFPKSITIGYQKLSALNSLQKNKQLDQRLAPLGVKVNWIAFPAGPQLLEALSVNSAVFGETGDAPPIFAQASGAPIIYAAYRPARPKSGGLLVAKGSAIQSVADLKGKKVATTQGSSAHWFLVKALESAGLKLSDITPIYLSPPDTLTAFIAGRVDAWATWEPFKSLGERTANARLIADGQGLVHSYGFYLARRDFAEHYPKLLQIIKEELAKADAEIVANPKIFAADNAKDIGLPPDLVVSLLKDATPGVLELTPEVAASQQEIADKFFEIGLLQKKISIQDALLKN